MNEKVRTLPGAIFLRVENIQVVDINGGYKGSIFRRTRLEIYNDFPGRFRLGQEALLVRNLAAKTPFLPFGHASPELAGHKEA